MIPANAPQQEHYDDAIYSCLHMVVGDVDVKVKIVAIGQPSEAVNIFCTQQGGGRQGWDSAVESQAQNLLEIIRQSFNAPDYKAIPLMAHNYAGLKLHRACPNYTWSDKHTDQPSQESIEIFLLIRQILEGLISRPQAIYVQPGTLTRHSFHKSMAHQSLRNEIARILGAAGQNETKINSLMRLIDRAAMH